MKRFLALALAMLMTMGILTGCSANSIRMVDLSLEMSQIKSGTSTGSFSITLNEKAISKLHDIELPFKDLTIEYEAKQSLSQDNFGISMALKCSIDGKSMDFGNIFMNDKNIYISSGTLFSLIDLAGEVSADAEMAEIRKALESAIDGEMYIEVMSADDYEVTAVSYNDALTNICADFIKDIFWDFRFYSVKRNGDTYSLSMTASEIQDTLVKMAEYLARNSNRLFEAAERFVTKIYDSGMNELLGIGDDPDEILEILNENKADTREYRSSMAELAEMIAGFDELKDYEQSSFDYSIGTYKNYYLQQLGGTLKYGNETLIEFTSKTKVVSEDVTFDEIKILPYDDFTGIIDGVSLFPYADDNSYEASEISAPEGIYAMISWETINGGQTNVYPVAFVEMPEVTVRNEEMDIYFENDSVYLPLKQFSAGMREEILWDADTLTAYAIRNGQTIEIDSFVYAEDGMVMINVYDFAKLGYIVEYINYENEHLITLTPDN